MAVANTTRGLYMFSDDPSAAPLCIIGTTASRLSSRTKVRKARRRRKGADEPSAIPDEEPTTRYDRATWNGKDVTIPYALFIAALAGKVALGVDGAAQLGLDDYVVVSSFVSALPADAVYSPWSMDSVVHMITCFYYFQCENLAQETIMFFRTFALVQRAHFRKKPMDVSGLFAISYGERSPIEPDTAWWRMRGVLQTFDSSLVALIDRALIVNTSTALGSMSWEMSVATVLSHAVVLDGRSVMTCDTRTCRWSETSKGLRGAVTKKYVQSMEILQEMHLPSSITSSIERNLNEWVTGSGNGLPEGVTVTAVKEIFTTEPKAKLFAGTDKMMVSLANAMIYVDGDEIVVGPTRPDHFITSTSVLTIPGDVFTHNQPVESNYAIGDGGAARKLYDEYRQRMWPDDVDDIHPEYPSVEYEQFLRTQAMNLATGRMDKKATVIIGSSGDEGKSLLIYLLSTIFGENYAEGSSSCVTRNQGKTTAAGHTAHLEPFMRGTALVVISDLNPTAILNMYIIKLCTGEDSAVCRVAYGKTSVQFWYRSKVVIITNGVGPLEPGYKLADARRLLFHKLVSRFVERSEASTDPEEQRRERVYPLRSYNAEERTMLASQLFADIVRAWERYAKHGLKVDTRTVLGLCALREHRYQELLAQHAKAKEAAAAASAEAASESDTKRRRRRDNKKMEAPPPPAYRLVHKEQRAYAPSHYRTASEYHIQTNPWTQTLRAIIATNGTGRLPTGKIYKRGCDLPEQAVIIVNSKVLRAFEDYIPVKRIEREESAYETSEIIENLVIAAFFVNVATKKTSRSTLVIGYSAEISYYPIE